MSSYRAREGRVYASTPEGEVEVGTALSANGRDLERFERALEIARNQRRAVRSVPGHRGWVYGLRLFDDDLGWRITVHETGGERRTIGLINEGTEADAIRALELGKLDPNLWHPASPDEL